MERNNATSVNWHFFSLFWSLQIKRCWSAYWSARQQREGLSTTEATGTALTVFKFVSGKMQWLYISTLTPTSTCGLKEAVAYQMQIKRVPAALKGKQLDEFPSLLKSKEEECYYCHTSLSGPYEITGRAMIIGVTRVKRGTRIPP